MSFAGLPEPVLRLVVFAVVFAAMAVFELAAPRLEREEMAGAWKSRRWIANTGALIASSLLLRLVFPLAAVGVALWAQGHQIGLLRALGLPVAAAGLVAFVVLDFAVWLEHVASHKVPLLWRIHRMHHTDTGFDVTTALRFHPLEIIISMVWKSALVVALGAPPLSVLLFEIVLNGAAMFNHANIRIRPRIDRALRTLIVTPDMHRVHHSVERGETDSNYGFNFSVWDRLFSTYVAAPAAGHEAIELGLRPFRDRRTASLFWLMLLPFRR